MVVRQLYLAGDEGEHNKSNPAVNRDKVVGHSLIIQRSGVLAPASRVDTNDHQNETQHVQEGMAPLENFNVGVRKVTIEENTYRTIVHRQTYAGIQQLVNWDPARTWLIDINLGQNLRIYTIIFHNGK